MFMECPECGEEVNSNANFCGNCGASLNEDRSFEEVHTDSEINHMQSEAESVVMAIPYLLYGSVFAAIIWGIVILAGFQDLVFGNIFAFMGLIVALPLALAFVFLNYYVKNPD